MIHVCIERTKTSKLDSSWLALYKIVRLFDNLNAEIGIRVGFIQKPTFEKIGFRISLFPKNRLNRFFKFHNKNVIKIVNKYFYLF